MLQKAASSAFVVPQDEHCRIANTLFDIMSEV
jgi:hypothetical protein